MDTNQFDALTRRAADRRSLLAGVLAGLASVSGVRSSQASAKKGKGKKRCGRGGTGCSGKKRCCPGRECVAQSCCPAAQVFVECIDFCRCEGNLDFCCAEEPDPPQQCPTGPDLNAAFCCPADKVCGATCCDPFKEECAGDECQCRPENQCGTHCCDPRFFACNETSELCECILPNPLDCPAGSGGFARVRRLRQ